MESVFPQTFCFLCNSTSLHVPSIKPQLKVYLRPFAVSIISEPSSNSNVLPTYSSRDYASSYEMKRDYSVLEKAYRNRPSDWYDYVIGELKCGYGLDKFP